MICFIQSIGRWYINMSLRLFQQHYASMLCTAPCYSKTDSYASERMFVRGRDLKLTHMDGSVERNFNSIPQSLQAMHTAICMCAKYRILVRTFQEIDCCLLHFLASNVCDKILHTGVEMLLIIINGRGHTMNSTSCHSHHRLFFLL